MSEQNKSVLLIDDVREPSYVYKDDEESSRYTDEEVHVVRNGEMGIAALRSQKWDVVLLDHDMGHGANGMDVLKFLAENPNCMPNKIYLVTANIIEGPKMCYILNDWHSEGKLQDWGWKR